MSELSQVNISIHHTTFKLYILKSLCNFGLWSTIALINSLTSAETNSAISRMASNMNSHILLVSSIAKINHAKQITLDVARSDEIHLMSHLRKFSNVIKKHERLKWSSIFIIDNFLLRKDFLKNKNYPKSSKLPKNLHA